MPTSSRVEYLPRPHRALDAQPNKAHILLAKLAVPSYLRLVAPAAQSYHLITQNIDGLSPTALRTVISQLPNTSDQIRTDPDAIIEMHGRLFDLECTECDYSAENRSNPLCPALGAVESELGDYTEAGSKPNNIPVEDLPRCPTCGALARPGIVWFGEVPHAMDEIDKLVEKADLCLVVGSSSTVCDFTLRLELTD